jgi:hypothetical protein
LFLSLYFFCFCFFLGSCCFLLLCSFFEPHAGGNDRGNTELRKAGGGGSTRFGHVAGARGCSDRALYASQPAPGANGRCAARGGASTRRASRDLRWKRGKGKTKRRRKKR